MVFGKSKGLVFSVVLGVQSDRQCTIPLSRLASKSESSSDNISRLYSKAVKSGRTDYREPASDNRCLWINEIFSEKIKNEICGLCKKSRKIGAL